MTDKWTDNRCTDGCTEKIMLLSNTHTIRGNDVASLVEFRLLV